MVFRSLVLLILLLNFGSLGVVSTGPAHGDSSTSNQDRATGSFGGSPSMGTVGPDASRFVQLRRSRDGTIRSFRGSNEISSTELLNSSQNYPSLETNADGHPLDSVSVTLVGRVDNASRTVLFTTQVLSSTDLQSAILAYSLPETFVVLEGSPSMEVDLHANLPFDHVILVRPTEYGAFRVWDSVRQNNSCFETPSLGSDGTYVVVTDAGIELTTRPLPELLQGEPGGTGPATPPPDISTVHIGAGTIDVYGCLVYVDEDEGNAEKPFPYGVPVWLNDSEQWPLHDRELGYGALTDTDGCFHITGVPNVEDHPLEQTLDPYASVWPQSLYDGDVLDNQGNHYTAKTIGKSNVPDGFVNLGTTYFCTSSNGRCPTGDAKNWFWNIFFERKKAADWLDNRKSTGRPPPVDIYWPSPETHYDPADLDNDGVNGEIDIMGDGSNPHQKSDTVILHEYGHFVSWKTWTGKPYTFEGEGCYHCWCDTGLGTRCAWSEGWAHYFSAAVRGTATGGAVMDGASVTSNVESGVISDSGVICNDNCNVNEAGDTNEFAVAGTIWDLADTSQDNPNVDAYSDQYYIGDEGVWQVVRTYSAGIHTTSDFYSAVKWKQGSSYPLWVTLKEHGIEYESAPRAWPEKPQYHIGETIILRVQPTPAFGVAYWFVITAPGGSQTTTPYLTPGRDWIDVYANELLGSYRADLWAEVVVPNPIPELVGTCSYEIVEVVAGEVKYRGVIEWVAAPDYGVTVTEVLAGEISVGDQTFVTVYGSGRTIGDIVVGGQVEVLGECPICGTPSTQYQVKVHEFWHYINADYQALQAFQAKSKTIFGDELSGVRVKAEWRESGHRRTRTITTPTSQELQPGLYKFTAPSTARANGVQYRFAHWEDETGATLSGSRTLSYNVQPGKTLYAVYGPRQYTLTVDVKDATGARVPGATVEVTQLGHTYQAMTNSRGRAVIRGIYAGQEFTLTITKDGYEPFTVIITITRNTTYRAYLTPT